MKDFTDITFVLDRSGSMSTIARDVVGGYKQFVEDQKKVGDNASMSLMQFDTVFEKVFSGVPIRNVAPELVFHPRGMTALLDAVGKTILEVGGRLRNLPESERPDKVMIVVITDGEENASHEFTIEQIRRLVKLQTDSYNWQFLFLGANIDSFATGGSLSVTAYNTANYVADSAGVSNMMRGLSTYAISSRTSSDGRSAISMTSCMEQAALDALAQDANSVVSGTTSGSGSLTK